jgi:hypothetical protein
MTIPPKPSQGLGGKAFMPGQQKSRMRRIHCGAGSASLLLRFRTSTHNPQNRTTKKLEEPNPKKAFAP